MAKEFTQLVEDLGYSKTFYPVSKTTQYLNAAAARKYLAIYQNRKEKSNRVVTFFKYTLPLIIAKHHRVLLITFSLFVVFVTIGFFSAKTDQSFVRQVLGDYYVDMTEQNIKDGHPFGVYGYGNEFLSFIYIFINNMYVSLIEFGGGIFLAYPTITSLMYNSVTVGAFEFMFYSNGLLKDSLLTIMLHGTIRTFNFRCLGGFRHHTGKKLAIPGHDQTHRCIEAGGKRRFDHRVIEFSNALHRSVL
jgi:uncharacterized membrane protein SpoIIM required for sporulation